MTNTPEVLQPSSLQNVPVDQLQPNPWNRKVFDPETLKDLATSIKAKGVIEPLVVRPLAQGYEICSGNRRWLAAKAAGLTEVPCQVRPFADDEVQSMNLITNIQREDIGALEKASMLKACMESGKWTQTQIAEHLGKSPAWISQVLGFLDLPKEAQEHLASANVGVREMRAIASLPNEAYQKQIAKEVKEGVVKPENIEHRVRQLHVGKKVSETHRKKHTAESTPTPEESAAPSSIAPANATPASTVLASVTPVSAAAGAALPTTPASAAGLASHGIREVATEIKDKLADHYVGRYSFLRIELRNWLDRAWESGSTRKLAGWAVAAGIILFAIHPVVKLLTWWIP